MPTEDSLLEDAPPAATSADQTPPAAGGDPFGESYTPPAEAEEVPTGPVVVGLWLSDLSRERLRTGFPCQLVDDVTHLQEAELLVISTRGPRARALPLVRKLRAAEGAPIAVVCHTGGEALALEIMRAGGSAVVAEGNEASLRNVVAGQAAIEEESLLSSYEQRVGSHRAEETSSSSIDRVTGLPGASTFVDRLAEMNASGVLATVGYAEVVNLREATSGLDQAAVEVLRRRLSTLYRDTATRSGAELFLLTASRYAFVGRDLTPESAHDLSMSLARIARSFAPAGTLPLLVGAGYAGPEVASDLSVLRELAERALEAAVAQEGDAVVNAEYLSTSLAASTELDIALRMISYLSEVDRYPGSHSRRVAEYATELGRYLGYEGRDLLRVQLAALLHDVGKVGLPPEAMHASPELEADLVELYRSHVERGARYAETTTGPHVADIIRAHHECWDGSGFPQGLSGEDIPMGARIVSVANAYDALRSLPGEDGRQRTPGDCLDALRQAAESAFDPVVLEAAELAFPR